MPAVQMIRLKAQIGELAWQFTRPGEFQQALTELFNYYSERSYRPGQAAQPVSLTPMYHLPLLILRQLALDLSPYCLENPSAALALADTLWKDIYLEPRLLAVTLLGHLPVQPEEPLVERLQSWCQPGENKELLNTIFRQTSLKLRRQLPERWLGIIKGWLNDPRTPFQAMGLNALLPLIQDRDFENLPPIFGSISPLLQSAPAAIQVELIAVISALARRSPKETVYYLRQVLTVAQDAGADRLIRKTLPAFTLEDQTSLKSALQTRPG
jgi:hypothetical protein